MWGVKSTTNQLFTADRQGLQIGSSDSSYKSDVSDYQRRVTMQEVRELVWKE